MVSTIIRKRMYIHLYIHPISVITVYIFAKIKSFVKKSLIAPRVKKIKYKLEGVAPLFRYAAPGNDPKC